MKRTYAKPVLEVEEFMLNTSIASCGTVVTAGPRDPANPNRDVCAEFDDVVVDTAPVLLSDGLENPFYDKGSCDCYYSAGGYSYFMS